MARPPLAVLAFMSIDWQIARPARVGDTVRCRLQTMAKRSMRDAGVIIEAHEIVDQRDDARPVRALHVPGRQASARPS